MRILESGAFRDQLCESVSLNGGLGVSDRHSASDRRDWRRGKGVEMTGQDSDLKAIGNVDSLSRKHVDDQRHPVDSYICSERSTFQLKLVLQESVYAEGSNGRQRIAVWN